jgi:hypothetical protein
MRARIAQLVGAARARGEIVSDPAGRLRAAVPEQLAFRFVKQPSEGELKAIRDYEDSAISSALEEGLERRRKGMAHEGQIPWSSCLIVREKVS